MSPTRVLLVSASYSPEQTGTGPYSGELAAGLAARGLEVDVLALPPHFPAWRVQPGHEVAGLEQVEQAGGVTVHRLRGYIPRRPDALRRAAFEAVFAANALRAARSPRSLARPDVVVAVCPPLLEVPAAQAMARRWRVPCVMHIQDLVPGVAAASGMVSSRAMLRAAEALERQVYRRADLVTVISPGFARHLATLGFGAKTVVLPNWVRAEDARDGRRSLELRKELGVGEDEFAAIYSGTISRKQGVELLLDAAAEPGAHGLRILAVGEGANRGLLEEGVASGRAPALTLQPLQPRERVPDVLASCDAALLPQLPGVGSTTLPGKLTTYMAAGLPVVAAADEASDAVRLIRELDCGLVVPPGDAAALVAALHELRAEPEAAAARGLRGRAHVRSALDPARLMDRWAELLAEVAGGRARGRRG